MDKVIDIEERIPSMRKKRRRRTNKKFLFILTVFVLALLAVLYFQSSYSKLDQIHVVGAQLHDSEDYVKQSGLLEGDPVWGFGIEEIEQAVSRMDGVRKVEVSRKWLRDAEIAVVEWKPVAYLFDGTQYELLLENGDLFKEGVKMETEAPILNNFDDAAIREEMTGQLLQVDSDVYDAISEIIYEGTEDDSDRLRVYMNDGYEVRAVISSFADKMNYYPQVTAQLQGHEKGVIDMEVGTYFTPFSEMYGLNEEGESIDEENE
ncbi:cell-division initiation protein [Bacillus sp. OxB-1]|uniref:cell division protein FtsQ/DivIB n=1 Tax=Bacillus sp. (strain OxB-1) TaxID=98228 RepID=UPI0005820FAA|nr:cell division protein FtsQ/DivIB [Bacillus sp. OxB-1]BAQ10430.1 cell-division initiation protein [Bacillus sp. OxB-1]